MPAGSALPRARLHACTLVPSLADDAGELGNEVAELLNAVGSDPGGGDHDPEGGPPLLPST